MAAGRDDGVPPRTDRTIPLPIRVQMAEQAFPAPNRGECLPVVVVFC
jgi:hypothetical protein